MSDKEAYKRLLASNGRPLLAENDREKNIRDLLGKRSKLYLKYADLTIDNNDIAPEEAADIIIEKIKGHETDRGKAPASSFSGTPSHGPCARSAAADFQNARCPVFPVPRP